MIHDSMPLCKKINKLVVKEQTDNVFREKQYDFYSKRYEKYTNNGLCPCCNKEEETTRHLFYECKNNTIKELRDQLPIQVYDVST